MDGLIAAYVLDGEGGGTKLGWEDVEAWQPGDGPLWLHLDYENERARRWLIESSGLTQIAREALLAHDPRPRSLQQDDGLVVVIRGINQNAGAQPEDMVSLRLWIEGDRVITVRHRRFPGTKTLRERIDRGQGPTDSGSLLHQLYDATLAGIAETVDELDLAVDDLEDEVLAGDEGDLRHRLALVRRRCVALRRHVWPQKATLATLPSHRVSWLSDLDRLHLGEASEQQLRIIDELDSARERAAVTHEELEGRLSQLMDRRLYVLSLIAAVSLPLGILTGLLGVNVGGIPLRGNPYGFALVCVLVVGLCVGQLWLFRKLRWL